MIPKLYPPTRAIVPILLCHCNTESSSQQPPREASLYGELQVPT